MQTESQEKERADIYTCNRVELVTDDKNEKCREPDSLVPADEEKCARNCWFQSLQTVIF